jgi:THO complex subunit 4
MGTAGVSPVARARIAATASANGSKVVAAAPAVTQPTDKIIVSNLPTDVNETQVKVCQFHVCLC